MPNADGFDLGTVPLRPAFARSCNTTFAERRRRAGPDGLPTAALRLGLGADYAVPADHDHRRGPGGPGPGAAGENDAFGQGQVLASPLGMALVAATVAHGAPVVPQLVAGRPTEVLVPATAPDPAALEQVRRDDARSRHRGHGDPRSAGWARCSARPAPPSSPRGGRAHGWFVGYRGDLAFAVLVVDGGSSEPAVAAAARFLGTAPR